MATGGKTDLSSCCSQCLDDGRNTVAKHYCVDCELYFCTKCVKSHTTIPVLRKHQVNDVNSSDVIDAEDTERGSESVDSFRCTIHEGKHIDTFCNDHNKVFCGTCAVIKHRSCTTISIAVAAKDFKSSPAMKKFKDALTDSLVQCKQETEKRSNNLDSIDQQKLELIENVDKYEEKVIAKIKELANISRNEIRSKYDEQKTALGADIEVIDVLKATTVKVVDKLEHSDDELLFVIVKTNEESTKDGEMLLQSMKKSYKERALQFYLDTTLETRVLGMESLGQLDCVAMENKEDSVVKEYEAKFDTMVNIKQSGESNAQIVGICLMDSSDIVLTDCQNNKLKRFSSNLQYKDSISLSGYPGAVCKIDTNEVAVRIRGSRVVHIVSVVDTMQVTSSFTLACGGWGMTYDASTEEIFACEETKVSVYSKTGNKLRTYDKDSNGEAMFSKCRQIVLSENRQDVYVTDEYKGVIVLEMSGTLIRKVPLPGVSRTWPLCVLPGDICLTGGANANVMIQVDKTGKQVGSPINIKSEQSYTLCAVYDRERTRLLVGGNGSIMSVFTMTAK